MVTVQGKQITDRQVSNLFWVNLGIGCVVTVILIAVAPVLAWFYKEPRLLVVAISLSMSLLIGSSAVQHRAVLSRKMNFAALAGIDIGSITGGISVGITMAWLGCSYWSLVGMQLSTATIDAVLSWSSSHWWPKWPARGVGTKSLVHFGASMTLGVVIRRFSRGVDTLLIGKFYGTSGAGVYSRAVALLMRPLDQFINPFDAVFVPVLSRLQDSPDRFRRNFLQAYSAIALIGFSLAALFLALAEPIVVTLLGVRWKEVAPIFAAFSLAAIAIPLGSASMWPLTTHARSKDIIIASAVSSVVAICAFTIGLPFGSLGVALAFSISSLFIRLPIQYYIVGRQGSVKACDFWRVFLAHVPLFAAVAGVTYFARLRLASLPPAVQLVICACAGLFTAIGITILVPSRRREGGFLIQMIRGYLVKVRK